MSDIKFIPYGRQTIDESDIRAVVDALNSDWLTTGPEVELFENKLIAATGARHAISCNSATAALHMASLALEIGVGDTVIVPSLTFLSTANAPHFTGAEVVFADVDPDTGLMTEATFLAALSRCGTCPKAVFPVHLNGHHVDMKAISTVCKSQGISIVEDAAHALGGKQCDADDNMVPTGQCTWSDMTIFSFHPVKAIAMGEGGAVTTNNPELARKLIKIRSHGMTRDPSEFQNLKYAFDSEGIANVWYYEMSKIGYNYRVSDVNCALGRSQLTKLESFLSRRNEIASLYDSLLEGSHQSLKIVKRSEFGQSGWHLYPVLIDFASIGMSRNRLMSELKALGIGSQVHYFPVHLQPYYEREKALELVGCNQYYEKVLSLPMYPGLSNLDVEYVAKALRDIVASR